MHVWSSRILGPIFIVCKGKGQGRKHAHDDEGLHMRKKSSSDDRKA